MTRIVRAVKHDAGMDLNLLRVFDALWHERKVAAAAERLKLSPPAVSNALARLRRATGDELFIRTPQGMLPTPQAEAMAPAIVAALAAIRGSLAQPRSFEPGLSARRWRLAMSDIGEIVFLPRLAAALRERSPQAQLQALRSGRHELRDALTRGDIDLAVGWLPDLRAGFHRRRLFEQRYVLLMAGAHPLAKGRLTAARLAAQPQVQVLAEGTGHERVDTLLRQHGIERRVPLALPHFAALPWVLRAGDGVAIVPFKLAAQVAGPLGLAVRELPVALPAFEVSLLWHHRAHDDPAHRWMRGLWVELFTEDTKKPAG
ncbi:MAG: LysR family transcriptional regulator [Betaproteobacteria bacterium]|nr:LysR family transcriptional regulator [Rubrivivax sp.]